MNENNKTEAKQIRLLEDFILDNEKLEQLKDQLAGFNIFEAIGMQTQEIRHSRTLAFLLDPHNSHGFGQYFLKKLLKDVARDQISNISPIDIDCADLSDTEVRCEWNNIDILIICRSAKFIIAIENKIHAPESKTQLKDYYTLITNKKLEKKEPVLLQVVKNGEFASLKPLFVFLTIDGIAPQDEMNEKLWISYSHESLVEILNFSLIANAKNMGNDQEVLVRHYIEMMKRHILTDSETAELARNIYNNHKQALDIISEFIPNLSVFECFETNRCLN